MLHATDDDALYRAPDPEPIDEDDYDVEEDITAIKSRARDTHLIDMWLKEQITLCLQLEKVYVLVYIFT